MGAFIHGSVGFSMDERRGPWTRFIDGCDASNAGSQFKQARPYKEKVSPSAWPSSP